MQLWALIVDCFREALDRKLFWVMAGISVLIAGLMACFGFDETGVSLLFGKWHLDSDVLNTNSPQLPPILGAVLTQYVGEIYICFIGVIVALVATCGIIPSLMESGAIDVVLSKPISRPMLFLGKYIGAMVFVALQAAIFVGLTFLVVGLRWGCWFWSYLWYAALIVILFSYVYCFCALFGVMTRNAMAALLLAMLAWFAVYVPQEMYGAVVAARESLGIEEKWVKLCGAAKTVVPKTMDITFIAGNLIDAATATEVIAGALPTGPAAERERLEAGGSQGGHRGGRARSSSEPKEPSLSEILDDTAAAERRLRDVNLVTSIGSSLLFEAVIVMIAMWKFSRRDF